MKTMNPHSSQYFRLTRNQVYALAEQHKYVELCRLSGNRQSYNTAIFKLQHIKNELRGRKGERKSPYISFRPISFQEYISGKFPFMW